jgi:plastocyanin
MSPSTAADVTIEIVANDGSLSFAPNPSSVTVGQTVAWHNAIDAAHTATADGGAFDTGNLSSGATSSPIAMTTAGSFPYHCGIHPSMVGTLTVNP